MTHTLIIFKFMKTFQKWLSEQNLQQQFKIVPIDPEEDWEKAESAYGIAQRVGIRPSRNKDVSIVALNQNDDVVGAIFSSFEPDEETTELAGETFYRYEFDVVVDREYQSQGIGKMLIQAAENNRKDLESSYDAKSYTDLQVINQQLHNYLTQKRGYEIDYEPSTREEGSFLSKIRKWMKIK